MPSTRELRRRIRSIKNTSQITKAMEMVAATKMRKAQLQALGGRPYNQTLNQILHNFLQIGDLTHPLLQSNDSRKSAALLISTDKSLCGALNTNLFRLIQKGLNNYSPSEAQRGREATQSSSPLGSNNIDFFTIGAKGRNFVVKTNKSLIADFENPEHVDLTLVRQIRKSLIEAFLKQEYQEIHLIFSRFINTLRQEPISIKLLPIDPTNFLDFLEETSRTTQNPQTEFLIEPNVASLLNFSLIHYLDVTIYQALLESKASEHSARMISMQNATNNAKDLVTDLQLTYNQTRQESITKELLEITSAAAALE